MKNSVLFVDDEVHILSSIRRAVVDEDYTAYFANSAQEALDILDKKTISVIVTDMRMPVMDGLTMLKIAKEKQPEMRRIVLSGFTQLSQVLASINEGDIHKYITKPWEMDDLLSVIREAVEMYNLVKEKEELAKALEQRNIAYKNVFKSIDTKLQCIDRDYAAIKDTLKFSFAHLKNAELPKGLVNIFEALCLDFVNSTPSYPVNFGLEQLQNELTKSIGGTIKDGKDLVIDFHDTKCFGNFRFFVFVFDFVASLTQYQLLHLLNCKVTSKIDHEKVLLRGELAITVKGTSINDFLDFVQELSRRYGCLFNIVKKHDCTVIVLEANLDVQN